MKAQELFLDFLNENGIEVKDEGTWFWFHEGEYSFGGKSWGYVVVHACSEKLYLVAGSKGLNAGAFSAERSSEFYFADPEFLDKVLEWCKKHVK